MRLVVNQTSEIISYVKVGTIEDAIEFGGTIPDNFEENFKSSFYLLQNNEIVVNPNYVEPTPPKPTTGPTTEQVMINQLGLKYAELSAKVGKLEGGAVNG
ncbi:hypothetical protein KY41_00355 [Latilactobacillus sakei]|uniref:DUF2977 domain-containing protein n=1 Tax=Latilactobacillus sakei TaxID=1599 RepID=UPI000505CB54|nr:hypothetical protein KY41_00355 [Latilactobacillus sakei]